MRVRRRITWIIKAWCLVGKANFEEVRSAKINGTIQHLQHSTSSLHAHVTSEMLADRKQRKEQEMCTEAAFLGVVDIAYSVIQQALKV